jgi:hypothetical protein
MTGDGVVFSMKRTQTDRNMNQRTRREEESVSSFIVEVAIEQLPERDFEPVKADKAYGFDKIDLSEYDSRRFVVRRQAYINKWGLANPRLKGSQGMGHITVYVDPVIPDEFRECVSRAVEQWNGAFAAAGIPNALRLSDDEADASLGYGTILMRWGNAYRGLTSSKIVHPVTGEILSARVNFMDAAVEGYLMPYLIMCGHIDKRVTKDIFDLEVRKDILTSMLTAELGHALGLMDNYPAFTARSIKDLRNGGFVTKNGMSASVMGNMTFNYVVQHGDKVGVAGLMPSVSSYDRDAIAFAYGDHRRGPSEKAAAWAAADKLDPHAQEGLLSDDILGSVVLGIENLRRVYPDLASLASRSNSSDETWYTLAEFAKQSLTIYMGYVKMVATLVGGRSVRPVEGKLNATTTEWVDNDDQREAMTFIGDNILHGMPKWVKVDRNLKSLDADPAELFIYTAKDIFTRLLSKEVLWSMAQNERTSRNVYTIAEMFAFFDHTVFADFDPHVSFTPYQTNVQMTLVECLTKAALQNNITGVIDDGTAMLHSYLLRTADKVKKLAENHSDPDARASFQLMDRQMNRGYFDMPLQQPQQQ